MGVVRIADRYRSLRNSITNIRVHGGLVIEMYKLRSVRFGKVNINMEQPNECKFRHKRGNM